MNCTSEQLSILNKTGNLLINAVAGSGKTTTLIEYARTRPSGSRILYIAFNKSVKEEAIKKFAGAGLSNVRVETAHSLAFSYVVSRGNYKVRPSSYKTHEIVGLLGLEGHGERHAEYIVASHINRFISYFCNSDKQKVQDLDYREVVADPKAKAFVNTLYDYIEDKTRRFLSKMDKGEIDITHDFYLKKFQLSNPSLPYDFILFDEGQDASGAMLDVFFKQKATKMIVGDTHQQIYGWRYAVNSLDKAPFEAKSLSTSFRFKQDIADLAMHYLGWKALLGKEAKFRITGSGAGTKIKTKAVIARTNLGLLLKAISCVTESKKVKHIHFEGKFSSYTYADDGASLYDVLNLQQGKHALIRDKLIKEMKNLTELEEYIDKTDDLQLGMMVEIVEKYGTRIPGIIKSIKDKHVDNKEEADMIFSTVHRSKGMEYDTIELADDFITKEVLEKALAEKDITDLAKSKLNEEINLLYVAVTRTRNTVHLPERLFPFDLPSSLLIHMIKPAVAAYNSLDHLRTWKQAVEKEGKSYSVDEVRKSHKEAYLPWTQEQDDELTALYCKGSSVRELAEHFGRTAWAIRSRIRKLELEDLYG